MRTVQLERCLEAVTLYKAEVSSKSLSAQDFACEGSCCIKQPDLCMTDSGRGAHMQATPTAGKQ